MPKTKGAIAFLTIALLIGSLAGCGAPSKIYAKDTELGVYFTVPSGWHEISEEQIRSYEVEGADAAADS